MSKKTQNKKKKKNKIYKYKWQSRIYNHGNNIVGFFCFTKFSFHHKWNEEQLLVINKVYMNCLASCWTTCGWKDEVNSSLNITVFNNLSC